MAGSIGTNATSAQHWVGTGLSLAKEFAPELAGPVTNIFNWKRLNGGTVPPFKMHPGGTVPPFKMHPGGTLNFNELFF